MSDSIVYRKDVYNALVEKGQASRRYKLGEEWELNGKEIREAIENVPSAEPRCIATIHLSQEQLDEAFEKVKADILSVKPKTGKWIKETKHHKDQFQEFGYYTIKCSVCGSVPEKHWHLTRYCPNCGSRMLEEGEEND